jgi:DNA-binding PadR family transcriptional regulator
MDETTAELKFLVDPALLIMVSLAGGAKHGYAIMKDVERVSGIRMSPGTLYGALGRLDQRSWIVELSTKNYRRRPYRLTKAGTAALHSHLKLLEKVSSIGLTSLRSDAPRALGA